MLTIALVLALVVIAIGLASRRPAARKLAVGVVVLLLLFFAALAGSWFVGGS